MYHELLIVPYGIETYILYASPITWYLLIVPYGIETCFFKILCLLDSLLIVPYGIETNPLRAYDCFYGTFNRTLWNWNISKIIWY